MIRVEFCIAGHTNLLALTAHVAQVLNTELDLPVQNIEVWEHPDD